MLPKQHSACQRPNAITDTRPGGLPALLLRRHARRRAAPAWLAADFARKLAWSSAGRPHASGARLRLGTDRPLSRRASRGRSLGADSAPLPRTRVGRGQSTSQRHRNRPPIHCPARSDFSLGAQGYGPPPARASLHPGGPRANSPGRHAAHCRRSPFTCSRTSAVIDTRISGSLT